MNQIVLRKIAEEYQTPAYVFDLDMLRKRVALIRNCLQKELGERVGICYAMKANPFLISPLKKYVDCYEVCSPGEFRICEKAGISMEQIVLSGVNKEKRDIAYAIRKYNKAGIYTIESRQHLQILESCAAAEGTIICALIRVTSGNQFGVDEDEVMDLIAHRDEYPHIDILGIQSYSGTQKKKWSKIEKELDYLDELCDRIQTETGLEVQHLEYGPGFYVPYFEGDEEVDDTALLEQFARKLQSMRFSGKITLEMGRYLAAYCGYYLTSIVDQKTNKGQKYCIVDGGIHHLNYFGQAMAMKIPHHRQMKHRECIEGKIENWNVCGSLCTVNDVIVKQLPLCQAEPGDILVFERVGAYSVTEGMYLFLSRDLPRILFYEDGEIREVRRPRGTDEINCVEVDKGIGK